jgi:anti-anti-sigma factor
LDIDARDQDEVRVVSVGGRLGVSGAPAMSRAINAELGEVGQGRVLLDLTRVDYVSSAGLRVLGEAAERARASGARLVLCGLDDPVRLALDLAGMTGSFEIEPTREAGLARLRP